MAQKLMNVEQCQELDRLIETLTTSGQPELDQIQLKRLKNICKQCEDYVKKCYHAIMIQLVKEHAEIRISSVQLIDVLFNRSHCFRELLLADFKDFMELTIEINADYPLPPPKQAAKILKSRTLEFVHKWHEKFGEAYKKLALGYNFLKNCKKVNFHDVHARSVAEQQREEERRAKSEVQQREKIEKTLKEIEDLTPEIESTLIQSENCLLLLLPDPDNFDIHNSTCPEGQQEDNHPGDHVSSAEMCTTTTGSTGENPNNCTNAQHIDNNDQKEHQLTNNVTQNAEQSNTNACVVHNKSHGDLNSALKTTDSDKIKAVCEEMTVAESEEFGELSGEESEILSDEDGEEDEFRANETDKNVEGGKTARDEMMRDHGIFSQDFSITINMHPEHIEIEENPDNRDILQNLKDSLCLIDAKYLPAVKNWLTIFTKRGAEQNTIKKVLDLRESLQKAKEKICRLRIVKSAVPLTEKPEDKSKFDSDSESDMDFEEVNQKEGYEPNIPDHLREEYGLTERAMKPATNPDWVMPSLSDMDEKDPTTAMSTLKKLKQHSQSKNFAASDPIPSTSGLSNAKKQKLRGVPTVPFGMDLFHWGEKIETPLLVRYDSEHRFWIPNTAEDKVDVNALESMKSRVINFVGKFEPVRWSCRAPLPNGKLCPRRDRHKCPFHGNIIPRDSTGQPVKPEHKVQEEQKETENAEWDDPELQAEIKAATGIDLSRKGRKSKGKGSTRGKGKGKHKRNKYPGLTDIKNELNPVRKRLEKKVLNRNALKRVAEALSAVDEKKRKDKFGNTFHYVHGLRKS